MDFLDDLVSEPSVVKARRFQPKAKPKPKKGPSIAAPLVAAKAAREQAITPVLPADSVSSQLVHSNELVENKSDAPKHGHLSAEAVEVAGSPVAGHLTNSASSPIGGGHLNVDASLGSQSPEDVISLSTTTTHWHVQAPAPDAPNVQNEEDIPVFPDVSLPSALPFSLCNAQTAHNNSAPSTYQDSGCYKESIACNAGDFQIDMEQLGVGDFSCLENLDITSEGAAASGKRAVKFQPKPKAQSDRTKDSVDIVAQLSHAPKLPSENQHTTRDDLVHTGEPDTVSDLSHVRLDDNFSLDPTDTVVSEDIDSLTSPNIPEQNGKHGKKKTCNALNSSDEVLDGGPLLSNIEANENGHEYNGINDGFHGDHNSPAKAPNESASNRGENNDGDYVGEEISQKKRPKKSKKVGSQNDKPARKRRKAAQEPDQLGEQPPKKFPHATRRKRCVDKSLLEAPEDELDLQRVPIRDLIILAEYKERQAKKEASAVQPPSSNERVDNTMSQDRPYDDDGTFGFDQERDTDGSPSTSGVINDTGYYNYHSFMQKTARVRWTKQDTELFYQGIRQFGTDFCMIGQLFPGRTRDQIKLKYKKEERQNPMRLHDALTSRAQDLSHFELVIERLQEQGATIGAEKNQVSGEEDSGLPTGREEEHEENLETHATSEAAAAKSEQNEQNQADQEPDMPQVESPVKTYDNEEEDDFMDAYESAMM